MKKMNLKKLLCLTAAVLLLAGALVVPTGASSAYQTYTYSIGGTALYSPDAYTATKAGGASEMGLESLLPEDAAADSTLGKLNNPSDLVTDKAKNVYIADTGNNRILVLDRYYKLKRVINTFTNSEGVPDALAAPQGVFVSEPNKTYPERLIWVCDTANYRIVVFNEQGEFQRIIEEPESTLFDRSSVYKPIAIAVDEYNRLYVVSSTTYQGIIVMTDDGTFTGFIGAQVQSLSAWQIIWRRFQTKEQRENSEKVITTEFNNISINPGKNLVYAPRPPSRMPTWRAVSGAATRAVSTPPSSCSTPTVPRSCAATASGSPPVKWITPPSPPTISQVLPPSWTWRSVRRIPGR